MDQANSTFLAQALFPISIGGLVWILNIIWKNRLIEERSRTETSSESEVKVRLQILAFSVSFLVGLFIVSVLTLSFMGLNHPGSSPSLGTLAFAFLICSLLSFRSIPLGTGSYLLDCLILGAGVTFLGITSKWGMKYVTVSQGSMGEGFLQLFIFGGFVGLIIRVMIYYLRGV